MFKSAPAAKIVIPGGTGHLGSLLAEHFRKAGREVVIVSRTNGVPWADLDKAVDGADVVINLAGRSVDCRYGEAHKREILESRVDTTRAVGEAIGRAKNPPHVWLQMSTATIYSHRFDAANDEHTGVIDGAHWPFSIDVARAWERAVDDAKTPRTRKVKMRTAVVMSAGYGGPFDIYRLLVRLGIGGTQAGGKQFVSWIHQRDFVRSVAWLIDQRFMDGAVNLAAPNPLTNAEFLRALRDACGVPFGIPAAEWMVAGGAVVPRT